MPTSRRPRSRASKRFFRSNRSRVLAALFGLAAGVGLFLAGTSLAPQSTHLTQHTPPTPKPSVIPVPDPDRTDPTGLQTLLEGADAALANLPAQPTPAQGQSSTLITPLLPPSSTQPALYLPPSGTPKWVSNASALPRTPATRANPQLAIVIDDMGEDFIQSKQALELLPATITYAFLPYPAATPKLAKQARAAGHELLIHLPMQPKGELKQKLSPQSSMLLTTDTPQGLVAKITNDLKDLSPIVVGVNNHMGSAFTQNEPGMKILLKQLDAQQLMFLDSLTIAPTATRKAAAGLTLPLLTRNVFLDDIQEENKIEQELNRAIAYAKQHGSAIAIGHPHPQTLSVLQKNLNRINEEGVTLVPLTHLLPPTP